MERGELVDRACSALLEACRDGKFKGVEVRGLTPAEAREVLEEPVTDDEGSAIGIPGQRGGASVWPNCWFRAVRQRERERRIPGQLRAAVSAKGTGVKAAQLIAKAGAQALITGQLGPNAAQFLRKSGIKIYTCSSGAVRGAIQMLQENGLEELADDDIQPGPGKMGGRGMGGGRCRPH